MAVVHQQNGGKKFNHSFSSMVLLVYNSKDKEFVAMLDDVWSCKRAKSFVKLVQYGGDDVMWKICDDVTAAKYVSWLATLGIF